MLLMICIKKPVKKLRVDEVFYLIGKMILLPLLVFGIWFSHGGFENYSQLFECSLRKLSGLPCPGCGITRAFYSLFRGNLAESIRFNPVVIYAAGAYLHFMCLFVYRKRTGKQMEKEISIQYYLYGAAAVLLLQWIFKLAHIFYLVGR